MRVHRLGMTVAAVVLVIGGCGTGGSQPADSESPTVPTAPTAEPSDAGSGGSPTPEAKAPATVATGDAHSCAIVDGGTVMCWGRNAAGQLGNGTTRGLSLVPVPVIGVETAVALAATDATSCALLANGTVTCWGAWIGGLGDPGQLRPSGTAKPVAGVTDAVQLAEGRSHLCALRADGRVLCWGDNADGALGDGTNKARRGPVEVTGVTGATAVSADSGSSCAIVSGGRVTCWGANPDALPGQSGPQQVPGLVGATALAGNCAIVDAGQVSCWGHSEDEGYSSASPEPGVTGATALTLANGYACAIVTGGQVQCWGQNVLGALGDGTHSRTDRKPPVEVVGVTGASSISADNWHTCAALTDGPVLCWGRNSMGQLGDGTTQNRYTPVAALLP